MKAFPVVQNTATVWDIILLLGAARLPALCAAFFMAQKHALYDLLPQVRARYFGVSHSALLFVAGGANP